MSEKEKRGTKKDDVSGETCGNSKAANTEVERPREKEGDNG